MSETEYPVRCELRPLRLSAHGSFAESMRFFEDLRQARGGKKLTRMVIRIPDGTEKPETVIASLKMYAAREVIVAKPGMAIDL